jgi:hypothetical protein
VDEIRLGQVWPVRGQQQRYWRHLEPGDCVDVEEKWALAYIDNKRAEAVDPATPITTHALRKPTPHY